MMHLTLRVDEEMDRAIDLLAAQVGRSRSSVMRAAMMHGLVSLASYGATKTDLIMVEAKFPDPALPVPLRPVGR